MKKLLSFMIIAALLMSLSLTTFAATETTDPSKTIEKNIAADTLKDTVTSASEVKDDSIARAEVKAFKGKLTSLFATLNTLRTQCKDLWLQLKDLNTATKKAWTDLKTSLKDKDKADAQKILTDIKAKIEPLRTQITALHTDIKALRTQKDAEWVTLRAAIKAKDEAKATTALNNIISLKSQIIDKLKSAIPLKQQILDSIK